MYPKGYVSGSLNHFVSAGYHVVGSRPPPCSLPKRLPEESSLVPRQHEGPSAYNRDDASRKSEDTSCYWATVENGLLHILSPRPRSSLASFNKKVIESSLCWAHVVNKADRVLASPKLPVSQETQTSVMSLHRYRGNYNFQEVLWRKNSAL